MTIVSLLSQYLRLIPPSYGLTHPCPSSDALPHLPTRFHAQSPTTIPKRSNTLPTHTLPTTPTNTHVRQQWTLTLGGRAAHNRQTEASIDQQLHRPWALVLQHCTPYQILGVMPLISQPSYWNAIIRHMEAPGLFLQANCVRPIVCQLLAPIFFSCF